MSNSTAPVRAPEARTPDTRRIGLLASLAAGLVAVLAVVAVVTLGGDGSSATDGPGATAAPPATTSARVSTPAIPMGVFRQTDSGKLAGFERWLGKPVDYVVDFSARDTWEHISQPDYLLEEWQDADQRLVYAVPMIPTAENASMEAGAKGEYDTYFTTLAQRLVKYGHQDAILRVGWEFNLSSWPWSIEDEVTFKAYFRNIVTAMRSVPGQKFTIDWNVNNGTNAYDAVWYYPGDDLVDYIGVDAYDVTGAVYPYPAGCTAQCREAKQKQAWQKQIYGGDRGLRFWSDFAAEKGKQMSIPEWGLWDRQDGTGGGDDPYFVARMHGFINDPANNVAYHAYFEYDGDNGRHSLVDSFPAGAREFKRLFGR